MISGNVNNEFFDQQAAVLAKPLRDALYFLKNEDMANHEAGRFPIELDGVPMILQVMDLTTKPREEGSPEIHRKYIDVQFCASGGPEKATWYSDNGNNIVKSDELDTESDILFYENRPETAAIEGCVVMEPGAYAVYFPALDRFYPLSGALVAPGLPKALDCLNLGEKIGDVTGDGKLNVSDASQLQRCLAEYCDYPAADGVAADGWQLNGQGESVAYLSDVNRDKVRDINDVTALQRKLAEYNVFF